MKILTINEEILLMGIWKLGENAYGVKIMEFYSDATGREVSFGTLYNNLDQLVKKEYVVSVKGEPTAVRGGKRKVYYTITEIGREALGRARELHRKIWEGVAETNFIAGDSE